MSNPSETPVSPLLGLADVVVALQNDLWNNKHFKVIDDHFADDITNHWPGQITSGKDELKTKFLLPLFNAFPDLKWVSLEVISDVSSIATRFTLSGTFKHAFMGIQPNGNKISWQGISIIHIQGGLISTVRTLFDRLPFHEALNAPSKSVEVKVDNQI